MASRWRHKDAFPLSWQPRANWACMLKPETNRDAGVLQPAIFQLCDHSFVSLFDIAIVSPMRAQHTFGRVVCQTSRVSQVRWLSGDMIRHLTTHLLENMTQILEEKFTRPISRRQQQNRESYVLCRHCKRDTSFGWKFASRPFRLQIAVILDTSEPKFSRLTQDELCNEMVDALMFTRAQSRRFRR